MPIPDSWLPALVGETTQPYYQQLYRFVGEERHKFKVLSAGGRCVQLATLHAIRAGTRGDHRAGSVSR